MMKRLTAGATCHGDFNHLELIESVGVKGWRLGNVRSDGE